MAAEWLFLGKPLIYLSDRDSLVSEVSMHESRWIILLEHNDLVQPWDPTSPVGAPGKRSQRKIMFLEEKKIPSCFSGWHLPCPAVSWNSSPFFIENAFCYLFSCDTSTGKFPRVLSSMGFLKGPGFFSFPLRLALPWFLPSLFFFPALPHCHLYPDGVRFVSYHMPPIPSQGGWNILIRLIQTIYWMVPRKWFWWNERGKSIWKKYYLKDREGGFQK